jgi:hypothetical protein
MEHPYSHPRHGGAEIPGYTATESRSVETCSPRVGKVVTLRHDAPVVTLVESAARGDEFAWNEIIRRYSPLVW